ncbi:DUF3916 domain-containing protein [Cytobacillus oceanisediminis]|uniref:Group-specific protein n=1 Tax=Cytobacillus oceanisediminis 2691 TaxID=1196031 RepID=A0A160MF13_9BACI|nr:DUF3916 domain-containing protein [Cytobacillus oceanisediminis]AND41474.1 group-specific protein [Cytobacillus oceanisediminis 2691]
MRDKKIRGLKRKTKNMVNRIVQETIEFPSDFYNGYWHLHLPVAQDFISSSKTPFEVKKICIETLISRAEHLIKIKPITSEKTRVVVAIDFQRLWDSQIIVFSGNSYFEGFFERNDQYQKWISITKDRNFESEWRIQIPEYLYVKGFNEVITEEEGEVHSGEIWFIGEL